MVHHEDAFIEQGRGDGGGGRKAAGCDGDCRPYKATPLASGTRSRKESGPMIWVSGSAAGLRSSSWLSGPWRSWTPSAHTHVWDQDRQAYAARLVAVVSVLGSVRFSEDAMGVPIAPLAIFLTTVALICLLMADAYFDRDSQSAMG
jgi:hypothetical protein